MIGHDVIGRIQPLRLMLDLTAGDGFPLARHGRARVELEPAVENAVRPLRAEVARASRFIAKEPPYLKDQSDANPVAGEIGQGADAGGISARFARSEEA
ncbi:MAG: hypothetical protein AMXMBFR13_05780 [Phycisphaerae bacterium]